MQKDMRKKKKHKRKYDTLDIEIRLCVVALVILAVLTIFVWNLGKNESLSLINRLFF